MGRKKFRELVSLPRREKEVGERSWFSYCWMTKTSCSSILWERCFSNWTRGGVSSPSSFFGRLGLVLLLACAKRSKKWTRREERPRRWNWLSTPEFSGRRWVFGHRSSRERHWHDVYSVWFLMWYCHFSQAYFEKSNISY